FRILAMQGRTEQLHDRLTFGRYRSCEVDKPRVERLIFEDHHWQQNTCNRVAKQHRVANVRSSQLIVEFFDNVAQGQRRYIPPTLRAATRHIKADDPLEQGLALLDRIDQKLPAPRPVLPAMKQY